LNLARGLDLDDPDAFHGGKNTRQSEASLSLDPYFTGGPGRGADAVVEVGEGRPGRSAHHGPEAPSRDDPTGHVERVDVSYSQGGERFGDVRSPLAPLDSPSDDRARERYDEGLGADQDDGVDEKSSPKSSGVQGANMNSIDVVGEVSHELENGVK
jgi:hypothetical protein